MNLYSVLSIGYDFLDKIWLSEKGRNPREVIRSIIPNDKCKVLDMCCGTCSNGISIAEMKPHCLVVGLDQSKPMLAEGRRKIMKAGIKNLKLLCRDAVNTGVRDKSFDFIIIGLVLHECDPELWKGILTEARRLLKDDGRLIVLEWEEQRSLKRKLKYAPLYIMEILNNPKHFKEFFRSDKKRFFLKYGFEVDKHISCNYTMVLEMKKGT